LLCFLAIRYRLRALRHSPTPMGHPRKGFDMTIGSSPRTKLLAADAVSYQKYHPFTALNKVRATILTGGHVYGVNKSNFFTKANRFRIRADGTTTIWTETDFPQLANAVITGGVSLTNANRMEAVVVLNNTTVLTRFGSDATITSGFRIYTDTINKIEIEKATNAAYGDGSILDVYLVPTADIVDIATLVANAPTEIDCYDFMIPDETCVLEQL